MRVLLDVHISPKNIGSALRTDGHDVSSASDDPQLQELDDEDLLKVAVSENRIMITFDVNDFPEILHRWGEAGMDHTGCIIVVGLDHGEFGAVLRSLSRVFSRWPNQREWVNRTAFIGRG